MVVLPAGCPFLIEEYNSRFIYFSLKFYYFLPHVFQCSVFNFIDLKNIIASLYSYSCSSNNISFLSFTSLINNHVYYIIIFII
jgi:hypothetical protein